MSYIKRFGVSLNKNLLQKFDSYIKNKNYSSRSKTIGGLLRNKMKYTYIKEGQRGTGTITLVYNHHKKQMVDKLTGIQHDYGKLIICSQNVHLDHINCLEIIVVKEKNRNIEQLADKLKAVKGVKHGQLVMAWAEHEQE